MHYQIHIYGKSHSFWQPIITLLWNDVNACMYWYTYIMVSFKKNTFILNIHVAAYIQYAIQDMFWMHTFEAKYFILFLTLQHEAAAYRSQMFPHSNHRLIQTLCHIQDKHEHGWSQPSENHEFHGHETIWAEMLGNGHIWFWAHPLVFLYHNRMVTESFVWWMFYSPPTSHHLVLW